MIEFKSMKIEFFVPEADIVPIQRELGKIGAGRIGNYDHCLSVTEVEGYWRPLPGSEPYDGEIGQISSGRECKVEVNCAANLAAIAVEIIRKHHPYDEPLINIIPLLNEQYGGSL